MAIDIQGIYNNAWEAATLAQSNATSIANSAGAALTTQGNVSFVLPSTDTTVVDVVSTPLSALDTAADGIADKYVSVRAETETWLTSLFSSYIESNFPSNDLITTQHWLDNQIANGGGGINTTIERALWQRDNDRLTEAAGRATQDVLAAFSSRRFPLPPGAAAYQASTIQQDLFAKSAESSRERAIKAWDAELDLVKFAISTAIGLRASALQLTNDYMKLLVFGAQTGRELATSAVSAKAQAVQAATAFYGSQIELVNTRSRINLGTGGLHLDAAKTAYGTTTTLHSKRADLTIETARMLATMAAAALNGAHTQFSYGENRDVTGTT